MAVRVSTGMLSEHTRVVAHRINTQQNDEKKDATKQDPQNVTNKNRGNINPLSRADLLPGKKVIQPEETTAGNKAEKTSSNSEYQRLKWIEGQLQSAQNVVQATNKLSLIRSA